MDSTAFAASEFYHGHVLLSTVIVNKARFLNISATLFYAYIDFFSSYINHNQSFVSIHQFMYYLDQQKREDLYNLPSTLTCTYTASIFFF